MTRKDQPAGNGGTPFSMVWKKAIPLIVALSLGANLAWGAEPSAADREEQNRRARQQAEERQQQAQKKDVFLQQKKKAAEDTSLPEETPSFLIDELRLEGDGTGDFAWLEALLRPYRGKRIGMQGINVIVKRLTNSLIDRGYVTTRILVPEQDLSTGTLRLVLIPGVISDIRLQDPKMQGHWQSAFPTRPGRILNLRDLEQGLEQMKRVPSQDVDMQLVPGDKPGESAVVLAVKRTRPWKAVFSLDDSGSKPTGRLQASESFSFDNLFGVNDLFNVSFNRDAERDGQRKGTRGDSVYYSLPLGNSTFTLSSSSYRYHQTVEGINQDFLSSGESRTTQLSLSQLLHRDQTSKTHLEFGVIKKKSRSYIDDAEIEVQRKDTTALKIGLSERRYFGKTVRDVMLAAKCGVPWLGAQDDPAGGSPDSPTTRYTMWLLDVSVSTPVRIGKTEGRFSTLFSGQYTQDILYGSEFFSIGNRYTVRGFDGEQTLAAERGWYLRNELSLPLGASGNEAYVGLDYGRIFGPSAPLSGGKALAGTAVGLRGGAGNLQYDLFVGWPLQKPDGFVTATPTYGFQLIYQL